MEKADGKKRGWRRPLLIALCAFLVIVVGLLIAAGAYGWHLLNLIRRQDPTDPNETLSSAQISSLWNETDPTVSSATEASRPTASTHPTVTEPSTEPSTEPPTEPSTEPPKPTEPYWPGDPEQIIGGDGNLVNILLIGQDRRPGQGRQRSDAMILCTFNKEKKTVSMTSFLRDLYVEIPGYGGNRLNAAYPIGGFELLDATLKKNFGVHVDGNVEVDFSNFSRIIDLLGGVDISLTEKEANYLNRTYGWTLSAGATHMNGEVALAYSRIRYIDWDFTRTDRQRRVLSCLIENYKNQSLTGVLPLLEQILPMLTTDMSNGDILAYAWDLFPLLAQSEIQSQHIPAFGAYQSQSIRGMSVLVPDLEANRRILVNTLLGG